MNLPSEFENYTRDLLGDALYSRLREGLAEAPSPTSIRLNPFKAASREVNGQLMESVVPWCPATGRYLNERPNFTFDPLFHAGAYYVQEAGSMLVDLAVRHLIKQPVRMLDLCAAPGGKSTALRAALPEGSLLFTNEPMRTRVQILSENIQKFGHEDVVVTNNYPRDYRKARIMFDAILADVPCSGEGMFRKDEGAIAEWSRQNVDNCWRLQREIVSDIWSCLRPGGLLIYSTCTFNAHEDEENVECIASELGADIISLPVEAEWGITPAVVGDIPAYRFLPGVSRSEGLFLAVLRKHGDADEAPVKEDNRKAPRRGRGEKAAAMKTPDVQLVSSSDYAVRQGASDTLLAVPTRWADVYDKAAASLKVMHAGVQLGTVKGKDVVPSQSLALSRQLDRSAFPTVDLAYADAVAYLRKEAVALPDGTPRGYVLLTYDGMPIGFEKNIGNRANNLYPQEWRIKSSHVPDEVPAVLTQSV